MKNLIDIDNCEFVYFNTEWLKLDKKCFGVLAVISKAADNAKSFKGSLSDICRELSLKYPSGRNRVIERLTYLEKNGFINMQADKSVYTITLNSLTEDNTSVIKIKKSHYDIIRKTKAEQKGKIKTSWENMLKAFIYLYSIYQYNKSKEFTSNDVVTRFEIGEIINCSSETISSALKPICSLDFEGLRFYKYIAKSKTVNGNIKTEGFVFEKVQGLFGTPPEQSEIYIHIH